MKMGSASDAEQWPNDRFRDALSAAVGGDKPKSKRAQIILVVVAGLIALATGSLFVYDMFFEGDAPKSNSATTAAVQAPGPDYVEFPAVTTNLRTATGKNVHVSLLVAVEVSDPATAKRLQVVQPRIMDGIHAQLWNRTPDELQSPEGVETMRSALTLVINRLIRPWKVDAVVFREFVVK